MKSLNSIHISYRFFPTKDLEIQGEFREFLHERVPGYTDILLEWHNQLCKTMASEIDDWWLAYGSRIMAWIPPIYQPYFFAAALREFRIKNNIHEIFLSEVPEVMKEYLEEIDPDGSYFYTFNDPNKVSAKTKIKSLAVKTREVVRLICSVFREKDSRPGKSFDFLIYSHFFGIQRWKNSGDHFYGKMLHPLSDNHSVLWSYYPSVSTSTSDMEEIRHLMGKSDCEFIDWKISGFSELQQIIRRIFTYLSQTKKSKKLIPDISLGGVSCRGFVRTHYKEMVEQYLPLTEWKIELYFKKTLKNNTVKKVIYPFEDKGLERAICTQCSLNQVETNGYAHAVHNDGHLYFKINSKMLMPPRPTKVLATGPAAAEWIKQKSKSSIHVEVLGSNRYRPSIPASEVRSNFNLLILIGQSHELTMLANWADHQPDLLKDCEITIRPYPYSDHEEQENAIRRLRKYYSINVNNLSLEKQIQLSDAIIFSSTSAAFEAMLLGRICIYANLHDIVPLSPLKDKGADLSNIDSCENSNELKDAVTRTKNLSPGEKKERSELQRRFAVSVYSEPDLTKLTIT